MGPQQDLAPVPSGTNPPGRSSDERRTASATPVERQPRGRYGGSAVTKITSGEMVGGRERNAATRAAPTSAGNGSLRSRLPLPATRTAPLCQSMSFTLSAAASPARRPEPAQQQQDGAVPATVGARIVHRGQHPLHVVIGEGPGQCGVLPFPRMVGTAPAMPAGTTPRVARKRRNARVALAGAREDD